jgi:hypothetical protein
VTGTRERDKTVSVGPVQRVLPVMNRKESHAA